ncbi:MAG TPA: CPBP family glutamic-type intramembrane protease [Pilimelia sp.]|nr:CPBP family glutamic-type intramembrane protease [Pilimelia sp.]
MAEVLALALAAVGVAVFLRVRPHAFPTHDAPAAGTAAEATRAAAAAVRRLCGLDVSRWRSFAVLSFDDATVDRLHQLGTAGPPHAFLVDCGLSGSWRVRFVTPGGSALVALSAHGEVVLFDLVGTAYEEVAAAAAGAPPAGERDGALSRDEVLSRLGADRSGGLWTRARPVGAGYRERTDEAVEHSRRLRVDHAAVRIDFEVQTVGDAVVRVDSAVELVADGARGLDQADQREALASAGGVLGSVLAFIGGILILEYADGAGRPLLAAVLGAAVLVAAAYGDVGGFRYAAVHAYDGTLSLRAFRVTNALVAAVSALAMTAVVVVAALAGSVVAGRIGLNVTGDLGRQVAFGLVVGAGWLALGALAYALLRRAGRARVAPSPDRRSLRTTGMDVPHVLSVTAQSAIGEEAVFRLLVVPVLLWLTGVPVLAALVAAALWAAVHRGGAVRPRSVRFVELTVVGVLLGVTAIQVGFVAALVAHATYNLVVLAAPLLGGRPADPGQPAGAGARSGAREPTTDPSERPEPAGTAATPAAAAEERHGDHP